MSESRNIPVSSFIPSAEKLGLGNAKPLAPAVMLPPCRNIQCAKTPKVKVAMARKNPFSRNAGSVTSALTAAPVSADAIMAIGKGTAQRESKIAAVYAPIPNTAAFASVS
ncbi:MAG: hypothetical protein NTV17_01495 [Burkholderiales bacterium]|nr:hypothetical protein [Burkholderiales bacterium]